MLLLLLAVAAVIVAAVTVVLVFDIVVVVLVFVIVVVAAIIVVVAAIIVVVVVICWVARQANFSTVTDFKVFVSINQSHVPRSCRQHVCVHNISFAMLPPSPLPPTFILELLWHIILILSTIKMTRG